LIEGSNHKLIESSGNPGQNIDKQFRMMREALNGPDRLVWSRVNMDWIYHVHGASSEVTQGLLKRIGKNTKRLIKDCPSDCTLIFTSDHGQLDVQPRCLSEDRIHRMSYAVMAGAGRTRYFYPDEEKYQQVLQILREEIGETGIIYERKKLLDLGVFGPNPNYKDRIGNLVVCATTYDFPAYYKEAKGEHGSFDEKEMMVPLCTFRR